VKERDWSGYLIVATGGFLPENMFLGKKKLILLAILVVVLRIERKSSELRNRTLTTE